MNTTVTAADGNVTVTDGTVTCTGDECFPAATVPAARSSSDHFPPGNQKRSGGVFHHVLRRAGTA